MKTKVAVYDSHEKAVNALKKLAESKFPMNKISLVGKSEVIDDHVHLKSLAPIKNAPAFVGIGAGALIGLLSGIGVFTIPGFGFLYGAGALVGAIGGFDLGLVTGGLGTILLTIGIEKEHIVKYEEHLNAGKFILIVNGEKNEILLAEKILHTEGTHLHKD
jgi:uncharacterized membrane protein